jgi:two-component system, sensor histidine kinase and response regulator
MEKKILLVEDNEVNKLFAFELLQGADYQVSVANNGQVALEMLGKEIFDCVLMDCQMPVMDGYEATRTIRKNGNTIPIIALTANAMSGDRKKCIDAGMNDYISKPFKLKELLSVLDKWISQNKKNKESESDSPTTNKLLAGDLSDLAGIEVKDGLRMMGGNTEIYKKILKNFYQVNSNVLVEINEAFKNGEMLVVARQVHTVKGSAASIGAKGLASIALRLESAIKNEQKEELQILMDKFSNSMVSVLETLKLFFSQELK